MKKYMYAFYKIIYENTNRKYTKMSMKHYMIVIHSSFVYDLVYSYSKKASD